MPLADHRSALIRVIEILSKNGRFDLAKRLVEQNGKQNNGRITSGSGLLCLVSHTNERRAHDRKKASRVADGS